MALQIQKPEVLRLVERLSDITGESAESVVETALRERLDRVQIADKEAQRRAEVYAIVHELAGYFREAPEMVTDHGELLYGEDGLPK
jgi:hypothetical protein